MKRLLFLFSLIAFLPAHSVAQKHVKHYVFFSHERERIIEQSFLSNETISGAQLKYTWRELEPQKDEYNFEPIRKDLRFLQANGKKLFIQLQDVSFDTIYKCVPRYIMNQPAYHGGANIQYFLDDNDNMIKQNGWVARRWDTAVADRFFKLLRALGKEFDGKIEGINLPETSGGFGQSGKWWPEGFSHVIYKNAIRKYMEVLKESFPQSVALQYANFMPGEWLPGNDRSFLRDLYAFAKQKHIGMGGPDIKVHNRPHVNNGYRFMKEFSKDITIGVAVQDGNYAEINPKTGKRVTVPEIYDFGKDYLGVDYIFWCTEEPFYSKEVLPFLKELKK